MMKPIKYDRHAKRRMEERGVTEEEVEITIKEPEHLKANIKGRQNAYRFIGERFLRVTFKEEVKHFLVITVTVRRRPFKE
jgi:hypothetical protein